MKEVFDILLPIKKSTGLDIDIYSPTGELLFYTGDERPPYSFVYHKKSGFTDGIISSIESDITYFWAEHQDVAYVGVIMGSNEVSRNYAIMVTKLIEAAIAQQKKIPDIRAGFKLLLQGELKGAAYEQLKSAYRAGECDFYVLSLISDNVSKKNELIEFLNAMADKGDIITETDKRTTVYLKKCGKNSEYSSSNDFAYVLYENIIEEMKIDVKINIGGAVHSFDDIVTAYNNSLFAYNWGVMFSASSNVYSYKEYVLAKMFSDIPKEKLREYLGSFLDRSGLDILKDDELMTTADIFMKNSLNISETSRSMYMHRNTLIYRLDKIESTTGLNIRHFNDALVFRLITMLNMIVNK